MKSRFFLISHFLFAILCTASLQPFAVLRANGQNRDTQKQTLEPGIQASGQNRDRVVIDMGAPSVWSLGQAHYLLAKMQKKNLELSTRTPDSSALDPNAINATKIQMIQILLDVEAQFDQRLGVENKAALDEHKDKLKQREQARADLIARQQDLDQANRDLKELTTSQARLQGDLADLPTPPPAGQPAGLNRDLKVVQARIDAKNKQINDLNSQITDLNKKATADVGAPSLTDVALGNGASLPGRSDFVNARLKKVFENMNDPRFAASIALDNFIGMQYEIIAKQLTLLRDEVGPDERIVFLELPSSIYTAACKGNDYIAQVRWQVTNYYDDPEFKRQEARPGWFGIKEESKVLAMTERGQNNQRTKEDYEKIKLSGTGEHWVQSDSSSVRAVEIIPRQSALNVNEVQSTTSQWNFMGVLKLLSGFGLRVNYQRQRELYEQYLQQEVFAAGFGKGRNAFGWTFGPLPGSKRISPGVRTTYAALVVPRSASLVKLTATGVAFHRKQAPSLNDDMTYRNGDHKQIVFRDSFTIVIPNEQTERFWVDSIFYTPAKKGAPVTVVVKGNYFSQQAGVLVDGVPLVKSLSLGYTATSDAIKDPDGTGLRGQYELVSSHEIVMKFAMPADYVGTPNITLITPERSAALNFLPLLINDHRPDTTLRDLVVTEPMFMPAFALQEKLLDLSGDPADPSFKTAFLKGTGFRRRAQVWVNGRELELLRECSTHRAEDSCERGPFIREETTGEYFIRFPRASGAVEEYKIRYRQNAIDSVEAGEFIHRERVEPSEDATLMSYTPNDRIGAALVDIRFKSPQRIVTARVSPVQEGRLLGRITAEDAGHYRGLFRVIYNNSGGTRVEKKQVSITVSFDNRFQAVKTFDVAIPLRPVVTKTTLITQVGDGGEAQVISLEGINLQTITKVRIGDKEAEIAAAPDENILIVKLPKGLSISDDAAVETPLTLLTADGTKVSVIATVGGGNKKG